jgi:NADH dehydrogenase FAD-containing subunit
MAIRHRGAGVCCTPTGWPSIRVGGPVAVHFAAPASTGRAWRWTRWAWADGAGGSSRQAFDVVLVATGAAPSPVPARGRNRRRGFLLLDASLRSISHPNHFAAGDCATLSEAPQLPKSGVHSVRQGALLALNLRKLVGGETLESYRPQKKMLLLIGTGARSAIAARGNWSAEGRWAWWWKDWIDRRWVKRLAAS